MIKPREFNYGFFGGGWTERPEEYIGPGREKHQVIK
jgi:hypothetical protein